MATLVWTRWGYRAVEPKPRPRAVVIRRNTKPAWRAILDTALLVLAWLVRCIALGLLDTAKLFRDESDILLDGLVIVPSAALLALCALAAFASVALP